MPSRGDTIDKAIALKDDAEVVAFLRQRMPDSLRQLEEIACGNVPRNAAFILKGIELQLRYTQPLPKQTIEHQGSVGIQVVNPYAEAPVDVTPVPLALPAPVAVPPVRRKKESLE